jgi:hypothetical protein
MHVRRASICCARLNGVDDELVCDGIERPEQRYFMRLSRGRHAQVGPGLRPDARKVRTGQRLTLIAIEENNVVGFGLLLVQLQAQANPVDFGGALASR